MASDFGPGLTRDLFDALWIEDVGGVRSRAVIGFAEADGIRDYALAVGAGHLRARLAPDGWRAGHRLTGAIRFEDARSGGPLDAAGLLAHVLDAAPEVGSEAARRSLDQIGAILDRADLWDAAAPALETVALAGDPLAAERLAAWRDRPFHPLARARHGFSRADADAYAAEGGRFFALSWCALARPLCAAAPGADPDGPSAALLSGPQYEILATELAERGLSGSHVALPLHPWQEAHVLPVHFADLLSAGVLVPLRFQGPLAAATSSLRTLALPSRPGLHLKLPLDVQTLGVRRTLPPQSLHNGLHGAALLAAGCARRPWLAQHVACCDEDAFWHLSETGDLYAERPALLGCALRRMPAIPGTLVPLASFAVTPLGGLPPIVRAQVGEAPDLAALFSGIAGLVVGTVLHGACLGFVPELHGQNALIAMEDGVPRRLVLRDHDTVRCAPAWLAESGLPVPAYLITDPVRNTLLLRRPEDLLAYAQTLAIDVALRAVAEAFAAAGHGFTLREARTILMATVERVLAEADGPAARREWIAAQLLDRETAPFKDVLGPLFAAATLGTSMPSRVGSAPNPLWRGGLR